MIAVSSHVSGKLGTGASIGRKIVPCISPSWERQIELPQAIVATVVIVTSYMTEKEINKSSGSQLKLGATDSDVQVEGREVLVAEVGIARTHAGKERGRPDEVDSSFKHFEAYLKF